MRVLSVTLINFGPFYGRHEFPLADRGLLLVMGRNHDEPRMDSNGSGKSTVFDGLDWCLWGVNPRGDHAEAVFNEEAYQERGAKCAVIVQVMADDGAHIVITRTRTKSKYNLEVHVDGEARESLDSGETQKLIEQLLGMDRDVFHAAVLFGQTDLVHYADATDGKRMEILTKILQLDDIDQYLDRAKTQVKASNERRSKLQADLAGLDGRLDATRPEDLDVQVAQWEQAQQVSLAQLQEQITLKMAEHHEVFGQCVDPGVLQAQRDGIAQELAEMANLVEPPELTQAHDAVAEAHSSAVAASQRVVRVRSQLDDFQSLGVGTCSRCGQAVTAEHLQEEVLRLRTVLQEAEAALRDAEARAKVAEGLRDAAMRSFEQERERWEAQRGEKTKKILEIDADLRISAGYQARADTVARELAQLHTQLQAKQGEANPWVERQAAVQQERYELERRRGQVAYELEFLESEVAYLDFWVQAFGPKGLKSFILDSRLQELSDAANEWLSALTGGTIWVRFEAQKQTRSKKLVNAPDVRVFRWNPDGTITERGYQSWSGGEKQRVSFCIDFGLSRLVARRADKTYDLLILDEVFRHLDGKGKEAVMEMLQVLAREKSSLIVVEHDTEFQGQFERRVLVEKRGRRSQIKEIDHGAHHQAEEGVSDHLSSDPDRKRVPFREPVRGPVG